MDSGTLAQWANALLAFAAIAISIYAARSKDRKEEIDALNAHMATRASKDETADLFGRMHVTEANVASIRSSLEHMPSKDGQHRLETEIAELRGELRVTTEALKPVARIADRLQEFLLDQASKK